VNQGGRGETKKRLMLGAGLGIPGEGLWHRDGGKKCVERVFRTAERAEGVGREGGAWRGRGGGVRRRQGEGRDLWVDGGVWGGGFRGGYGGGGGGGSKGGWGGVGGEQCCEVGEHGGGWGVAYRAKVKVHSGGGLFGVPWCDGDMWGGGGTVPWVRRGELGEGWGGDEGT